eukprot:5545890-Amphidinium_carterae.1
MPQHAVICTGPVSGDWQPMGDIGVQKLAKNRPGHPQGRVCYCAPIMTGQLQNVPGLHCSWSGGNPLEHIEASGNLNNKGVAADIAFVHNDNCFRTILSRTTVVLDTATDTQW